MGTVFATGWDGKEIFSRRDGMVKCDGIYSLGGTGRYESTVGQINDGMGRDGTTVPF